MEAILDERIARELKERYLQLESKGEILSQEQFTRYVSTFLIKPTTVLTKTIASSGETMIYSLHTRDTPEKGFSAPLKKT